MSVRGVAEIVEEREEMGRAEKDYKLELASKIAYKKFPSLIESCRGVARVKLRSAYRATRDLAPAEF